MAVRVAGGAAVDPVAAGGAPKPSAQASSDAALHAAVAHLSADVVLEELERSGCLATLTALKQAIQSAGGATDSLPEELATDERVRAFTSAKLGTSGGGDTPSSRLGLMVDYIRAASKRHGRRGHRHGAAPALSAKQTASGDDGWSREQIHALRAAMKVHPSTLDKNERFRLIAHDVGKSKRECYEKAKELRARAAARAKAAAGTEAAPGRGASAKERPSAKAKAKAGGRERPGTAPGGAGKLGGAKRGNPKRGASKRGGGVGSGGADALDSLLGGGGSGGRAQRQQVDDGWGDMLSHVKQTTHASPGPDAGVSSRGARGTGRDDAPPRAPAAGWGSGDTQPARRGWGSGAGAGAGAGAGSRSGPRRAADGTLIIEEDGGEYSGGDSGDDAAPTGPGQAAGPGWGAQLRRVQPDRSSLLAAAKRNADGDLVIEDAGDLDAELASAPVVRKPRAVDSMKIVSPTTLGFRGARITSEECAALRELLYANTGNAFNDAWLQQGFFFSEVPKLGYGLVQSEGGPCGPLASVNAYVVRNLLFKAGSEGDDGGGTWDEPSSERQAQALLDSLVEMLWQARATGRGAIVCVEGTRPYVGRTGTYRPDGFTEKLLKYEARTKDDLEKLVRSQLPVFMKPDGHGCCLFVYSVMLTRTIRGIQDDMDSALGQTATLIGAHNYATQEMVNLMLCGRAHSNVFNGTMTMDGGSDSITLRGVPNRSSIGFVTLFEHYGYVAVGSHYHQPVFPVWVVCSESHYSVLFSREPGMETATPTKAFDLYYYDMLARQDEVLRLTVDPTQAPPELRPEDTPPLDLCIRTRWKGAAVDWNGAEALL